MPVRIGIDAQSFGGGIHRLFEQGHPAIVERMGQRGGRMNPFESVVGQGQRAEERRNDAERMDGRAGVVKEAGLRQFRRAGAAADGVFGFQHQGGAAGAGDGDSGGQAVGTRADDDGVVGALSGGGHGLICLRRATSAWCSAVSYSGIV